MDKIVSRVVKFAEGLLDRPLTDPEKRNLGDFVDANYLFVQDKKSVVQVAELATEFVDTVENRSTGDFDLASILGINTFDRFISEINPQAKRKTAYMCLDSRYAQFNNTCTKLTWSFTDNLNTVNNSTNVVGPVRDIVSIRMQSIVVRKFASTLQRATILIEELSSQSFILPSGRRFHFVGLLNDLQKPINLIDRSQSNTSGYIPDFTFFDKYELLAGYKFNEGYYRFNIPITTLDNITISIGNPDTLVVLPKYEFTNVTILDLQSDHIDLELNEPHYYISPNCFYTGANGTWYSVFIDGAVTAESAVNDYLNSKEFTDIDILSTTQIRITFNNLPARYIPNPIVTDIIPAVAAPWTCKAVRFNSYRVIMNFELEYISD